MTEGAGRFAVLAGGVAGLALTAAGCGSDGANGSPGTAEDGPRVIVHGSAESAGDARVMGTLTQQGGCFALERDGGVMLAVWPEGTTSEGQAVIHDGERIEIGDSVDLGGGYLYPESLTAPDEIPDACIGDAAEVVVVD